MTDLETLRERGRDIIAQQRELNRQLSVVDDELLGLRTVSALGTATDLEQQRLTDVLERSRSLNEDLREIKRIAKLHQVAITRAQQDHDLAVAHELREQKARSKAQAMAQIDDVAEQAVPLLAQWVALYCISNDILPSMIDAGHLVKKSTHRTGDYGTLYAGVFEAHLTALKEDC